MSPLDQPCFVDYRVTLDSCFCECRRQISRVVDDNRVTFDHGHVSALDQPCFVGHRVTFDHDQFLCISRGGSAFIWEVSPLDQPRSVFHRVTFDHVINAALTLVFLPEDEQSRPLRNSCIVFLISHSAFAHLQFQTDFGGRSSNQ